MPVIVQTVLLLTISNFFMMSAWYLHLNWANQKAWYIAVMASWGIAFLEYLFHIPANRIGYAELSLSQLQILQVGMSLVLFIPFSIMFMEQSVKMDYIWATICLMGAAYFIFRSVG